MTQDLVQSLPDWLPTVVSTPFLYLSDGNVALACLYAYIFLVVLALVLTRLKAITVYKNLTDVLITSLIPATPLAGWPLMWIGGVFGSGGRYPTRFVLISVSILSAIVIVRTIANNGELMMALLAIIVKIPLSVLFVFYLVSFLETQRSGEDIQAYMRRKSAAGTVAALLGLLIYMLTREKGILSPTRQS